MIVDDSKVRGAYRRYVREQLSEPREGGLGEGACDFRLHPIFVWVGLELGWGCLQRKLGCILRGLRSLRGVGVEGAHLVSGKAF